MERLVLLILLFPACSARLRGCQILDSVTYDCFTPGSRQMNRGYYPRVILIRGFGWNTPFTVDSRDAFPNVESIHLTNSRVACDDVNRHPDVYLQINGFACPSKTTTLPTTTTTTQPHLDINKDREKPVATYYCVERKNWKGVIFTIDQKGTKFENITLLGEDGHSAHCLRYFQGDKTSGGRLHLTIEVRKRLYDDNFRYSPDCPPLRADSNWIFEWTFRISERSIVLSPLDIDFKVKCDFSKADNLGKAGVTRVHVTTPLRPPVKVLTQSHVIVNIGIIDPLTYQPRKDLALGDLVKLGLPIPEVSDGGGITLLRPTYCYAITPDQELGIQLTDYYGCSKTDIKLGPFKIVDGSNGKIIVSQTFRMFTFPNHTSFDFRCQVQACYEPVYSKCFKDCPL